MKGMKALAFAANILSLHKTSCTRKNGSKRFLHFLPVQYNHKKSIAYEIKRF